ncbi:YbaY family lipoprotein [Methanococcoides orientis]|uniref:YbaY family lipoprotein n=1 Tax=Methanococcoides orientis TaxID=2822137 RepID=UPI001E48400E|nr:YbaY family lipoprotein [Methanococcoides orientis]UGV39798.1 YbaY family lipoprotein [Methanococcoides orientis]
MKKKFVLGLTLLLVMAAAFSMGCTETGSDGPADDVSETDEGADHEAGEDTDDQVSEENGVQGMIIFDEPVESFSNATIYLKVEDVSLQDVASVVISEDTIDDVSMDAGNIEPVPYMINHPDLEERMTYSLSVHVDVDGDERLSNGDYYSTWHNPVPTDPGVHDLDVHVEMI